MLSIQPLVCLPLRLLPFSVPWRAILGSELWCITCPNYYNFLFLTNASRGSWWPVTVVLLLLTKSFDFQSLYDIPSILLKHLVLNVWTLFVVSVVMAQLSQPYYSLIKFLFESGSTKWIKWRDRNLRRGLQLGGDINSCLADCRLLLLQKTTYMEVIFEPLAAAFILIVLF